MLRHGVAVQRQRPGRVREEGEPLLVGVAEVDGSQMGVWREVERIHLTTAVAEDSSIGDFVKAVQQVGRSRRGFLLCALALHTAQQRVE